MFYSHQLLSKKGPFGQIWIAATIRPKINRKRAEQIDIEESCKQIIYPQVPLALRLSGILLGGIVRIYHHKVQFLHDDANEFLMKVKLLNPTKRAVDTTTLPRGKNRARLEAITNQTQEMYDDDVEQPMRHPDTPDQDDDEFFVIPSSKGKATPARRSSEAFQAASEDITLDEDNLRFPDLAGELDDRILPPDDSFMYDGPELARDGPVEEASVRKKRRKASSTNEASEFPEFPEAPEGPGAPEFQEAPEAPEVPPEVEDPLRRKRKRKLPLKKRLLSIFDENITEVPTHTFTSWLQDTSSIVNCKDNQKLEAYELSEKTRAMFAYPATFFSCSATTGPVSLLPSSLLELWKPQPKLSAKKSQTDAEGPSNADAPLNMGAPPVVEAPSSPVMNFETGFEPMQAPQSPANNNFEDYGSVEKLRTAFRTPSTAGRGEDFLGSQLGYTPVFSAATDRPTSASGKAYGASASGRVSGDLLTPTLTPSLTPAYKDPGADPRDNIDKITTTTLKCLREHFYMPGVRDQSLNELTEGMDATSAAKLFFQICVLASNRYISVNQQEGYGDITIGRGDYL